jgi:hypothetical protein
VVNVVGRLIDGIKAKGSEAAIDVSDIAQRESFDVIGMVRHLKALQQGPSVSHPDLLKAALAGADGQDGFCMMNAVQQGMCCFPRRSV